jgi:hypothetical protein
VAGHRVAGAHHAEDRPVDRIREHVTEREGRRGHVGPRRMGLDLSDRSGERQPTGEVVGGVQAPHTTEHHALADHPSERHD